MNLKEETLLLIKKYGKTPEEVIWVGSLEYGYITFEEFLGLSDFEYDKGYGAQQIASDLYVVGTNWWLSRHEYDGAEGWVFNTHPKQPEKHLGKIRLGGDDVMWETLQEINK